MSATATTSSHLPSRIFGLDALRALAILSVLIGHVLKVFYPHAPLAGLLGHGGFVGVELFYVLSGYLIGGILLDLGPRLRHGSVLAWFYVRRWLRTLPLFWLFVVLNVGLVWLLQHRLPGTGEIAWHALFLRTFAANRVTFITESFSLAVEEWFYLLFAAALFFGLKLRLKFGTVFVAAALAFYLFSTVTRWSSAAYTRVVWSDWQRVIVIYRFDGIMTGVIAAWVARQFSAAWLRHARTLALLGGLLALGMYATLFRVAHGTIVAGPDDFFGRTLRFNLLTLGFALLLPAASRWTLARETPLSTALRRTALWSYSIYLVHGPVIRLVDAYCFPHWQTSLFQAFATCALQVAATFVLSVLFYRWFEAPTTRLREKFHLPTVARRPAAPRA